MRSFRVVLVVLVVLAVATMACGLRLGRSAPAGGAEGAVTQSPQESPPQAAPSEVEATVPPAEEASQGEMDQPSPTPAPPVATEAPVEGGSGELEEAELDLDTSVSGLENLNSYRAAFRFDWNGTKGGQPVTGFMEMRSAFVRQPPAQELYFEGQGFEAGEDQGLGKVAFIQVGDTAWFYESESDSWMQVPAGSLDFASGLFFQPQDLLQDFDIIKGRRSPTPKQVNGVQCQVYMFDESDFGLTAGGEVTRADGEVCVAVDGGYVVQLVVDADFRYTDPEEVFEEGNIKMTFDISEVNQPITIEPPAEAEAQAGGREDVPMLPDASVEIASPGFISYRTGSNVADAAQFYQDEMPGFGWTADESNMVFDENALLHYNKGAETVDIIIGRDEGGTNVLITISQE
ncbi:MAG: hypothetical protein Kow0063_21230 [Anaerolineae bacterium]